MQLGEAALGSVPPGQGIGSGGNPSSATGEDPFEIQLEFFSGPLDLLLHLVARQEVSVSRRLNVSSCRAVSANH